MHLEDLIVFEVYILWMAWHAHALKTLHSLTSLQHV